MELRNSFKLMETPYCSMLQGELPAGCQSCVKGEKLVLFVTGVCPATCFFCPISNEKKNKDVVFANEQELQGTEEEQIKALIHEARLSLATGAGITGGDPLSRLDRTCAFIRALKKEFGSAFHIHLYTPLILINEIALNKLYNAGLDEIRFHPSLQSEKYWERMRLARKHDWKVGIEIPCFPDKMEQSKRLIDYCAQHKLIDFANLNELEVSDRSIETFEERGYEIAAKESYAVRGSREAAVQIMLHAQKHHIPVHFCTTTLKDRVQMGNRIKRRAANVAKAFEIVNEEGMLIHGAIYTKYVPHVGYLRKLKELGKNERDTELKILRDIFDWLLFIGMPEDAGAIDEKFLRIVLGTEALEHIHAQLKKKFPHATAAIVTEYPTNEGFIVEMETL